MAGVAAENVATVLDVICPLYCGDRWHAALQYHLEESSSSRKGAHWEITAVGAYALTGTMTYDSFPYTIQAVGVGNTEQEASDNYVKQMVATMLAADPEVFELDPSHWRVSPRVVVQRVSAVLRHAALREVFARCLALNGGVFSPARIPQQGLRHRWRELIHPAELWEWVEASKDFEWVRPMGADPQIRWARPRAASGAITVALAGRLTAAAATAVALAVPAAAGPSPAAATARAAARPWWRARRYREGDGGMRPSGPFGPPTTALVRRCGDWYHDFNGYWWVEDDHGGWWWQDDDGNWWLEGDGEQPRRLRVLDTEDSRE